MNTINKNMVVVYNSFSDDRFGGTENINIYNFRGGFKQVPKNPLVIHFIRGKNILSLLK